MFDLLWQGEAAPQFVLHLLEDVLGGDDEDAFAPAEGFGYRAPAGRPRRRRACGSRR
ncbi:MAG: hypothetical protein KDB50_15780 [Mycobacterium sp.]|nr:hypothetical protein [Mycobacterium sp.]